MRTVRNPQSICRFGFARCDITPPVGIYHRMWGAATHDQATGVHRPLTASALIFQSMNHEPGDPCTQQVVIALDHVLLWAKEMDSLLNHVASDTGLSKEQITFSFSHTHAAGLMGLERTSLPGGELIPKYLDELAKSTSQIVREAQDQLREVSVTYGTGRCTLAAHRDFWDDQTQQFVCGFNPEGEADDTMIVARINGTEGDPVAVVVNYACHPTTLAWGNTLISPDFPAATCELVEKHVGAPCAFIQGASGDLGPREGFVGDVEVAERNGRQLGHAALATLESLPPPLTQFEYDGPVVSGATIGTWSHHALSDEARSALRTWKVKRWTVDLPYRKDLPTVESTQSEKAEWEAKEQEALKANDETTARDCRARVERMRRRLIHLDALPKGKYFPFPITLLQMGEARWLFVESEPYSWLQTEVRKRLPNVPIIVGTLTNGSRPSYLPTKDAYGKGIYQETISSLAPGSLEKLVGEISQVALSE